MTVPTIVTICMYIANFVLAFLLIFISRKSASATWAWLLILFIFPIVGFVLYVLFGRNLRLDNFISWRAVKQVETYKPFRKQLQAMRDGTFHYPNDIAKKYEALIRMNIENNYAMLTNNNDYTMYATGKEKFEALLRDIEQAQHHIHIQYYIFKMDGLGYSIYEKLVERAKQGVKVKVLYDDLGSRSLKKRHFKELVKYGGDVEAFFPSILPMFNPRLNFRNHRKLVIIDGGIGYIGGFNVGDEYLGKNERFGFWRDIHLRLEGQSVHHLQTHFLFDWQQARGETYKEMDPLYFPKTTVTATLPIQIVSSGPDTQFEPIKESYIRMILQAKKYIYIQSPYFIPDDAFLQALQIAASSGVDVRVMTPARTDHPFIYGGNSAFSGDLRKYGGRTFRYKKGFLHTKMMVIDDEICTIGTTNIDVRSFSLNFEVNAIIFDEKLAQQCKDIFLQDEQYSFEMTRDLYRERPLWTKIREGVSRLLAPIL